MTLTITIVKDFEEGIPQLAALQESNDSVCVFRKFGTDAARVLLHKQMELDRLAKKIGELDRADSSCELRYRLRRGAFHDSWDSEQKNLLEEQEMKLSSYCKWPSYHLCLCIDKLLDDLLLKYTDVRALAPVPKHNHRKVQDYMRWNRPLDTGEDDFFLVLQDMVTAKRNDAAKHRGDKLENFLDSYAAMYPRSLINVCLINSRGKLREETDTWPRGFSAIKT